MDVFDGHRKGETPKSSEPERIATLIAGYLQDTLTVDEHVELDNWVTASLENQMLFEQLTDPQRMQELMAFRERHDPDKAFERVQARLQSTNRRQALTHRLWPYAAAAALIVGLILIRHRTLHSDVPAATAATHELVPGTAHAVLTLSSGQVIDLDSVKNHDAIQESTVAIVKTTDGSLDYKDSGNSSNIAFRLNTLQVPAGGYYRVTLADGTLAWLNAQSTLRYPASFKGDFRKVTLNGEAYFEVKKDAAHPFVVVAGENTVEVLGTHFNVNSYDDDSVARVTLAEGSVRVNKKIILLPGEQAAIGAAGEIHRAAVDTAVVLGWKNGVFIFKEATISDIMRQVARWYNCTVEYAGVVPDHFNAVVSRDVPASKLLHLLESTGRVHFKINNKTITVMP